MPRTGRRPGDSGSRATILDAARTVFGESGYERATIRGIARTAGVDPALVHHYFGTKDALFAAALQVPIDPGTVVETVFAGGLDGVGERLVRFVLGLWEDPETGRSMLAVLRSAMSNDRAAEQLREFLSAAMVGRLAAVVAAAPERAHVGGGLGPAPGADEAMLRATLVGSQVAGLAIARYVLGIEPLASAPVEAVVSWVAPTVQRYLTGPAPTL